MTLFKHFSAKAKLEYINQYQDENFININISIASDKDIGKNVLIQIEELLNKTILQGMIKKEDYIKYQNQKKEELKKQKEQDKQKKKIKQTQEKANKEKEKLEKKYS